MEDYSTVIWVVAIFAAMLFNATSQARKKAKKQVHETEKHTQHEAWPSWDTQSADEMRHPDSQEKRIRSGNRPTAFRNAAGGTDARIR